MSSTKETGRESRCGRRESSRRVIASPLGSHDYVSFATGLDDWVIHHFFSNRQTRKRLRSDKQALAHSTMFDQITSHTIDGIRLR